MNPRVCVAAILTLAQAQPLRFEVASVKPSDPSARGVVIQFTPGGGFRAVNARVRQLLEVAYEVQNFQISGGPGWIESEGFDILAKAPEGSAGGAADARLRLQALLAERFNLTIRRSAKEMGVYALVIAKSGPKLKEFTGGEGHGITADLGALTGEGADMPLLASVLSRRVGRPVVDRTGLTGSYQFKLEWPADPREGMAKGGPPPAPGDQPDAALPPDPSGTPIFSALQDQLGLKLEAQKGPVDILVIERVERPAAQ